MEFKNVLQKVSVIAFSGMMALSCLSPAVRAEGNGTEYRLIDKYNTEITMHRYYIRDEILRQMLATVQSDPTILRRIYATQYLDTVDYKKLFESVNSGSANYADTLLGNMIQCVLAGEGLVSADAFFDGAMHRSLIEEGLARFPEDLKGKILADFDEHYSNASESSKADVVSSFLKIASHERKKLISLTCDLSCSGSH